MRLAVYTTFCGRTEDSTFNPYPASNKFPHYFISNNKDFVETISKSLGYIPILVNAEISIDPSVCAKQAKVAKIIPEVFQQLKNYDYLLYHDDKIALDFSTVEKAIENLHKNNYSITMREHPAIPEPNVLFDFGESMYQLRYRCDWEKNVSYITEQTELGYKLKTKNYFATGVILRNMRHKDTTQLDNLWYEHMIKTSAACQISFHFARQRFNSVGVLSENIMNKYKRI